MGWVAGASDEVEERSRWKAIVATTLVFTGLMLLLVGLRFWVRRRTLHQEDWVTLTTALFSCAYSALVVLQTTYGLGLPVALQPRQRRRALIITHYAATPFYLWGLAGFKLALCISYLRITERSADGRHRIAIVAIAVFCVLANTIYVLLSAFYCVPLSKMFDPQHVPGQCLPFAPINYAISVTAIACDVVIFLLPIPLIQRLHLDRPVKLALTVMFALGLLTTILSVLRASSIYRVQYGDGDTSYFVIRSGLELNVGIITSCLPVLRPLLRHVPQGIVFLLPGSTGRGTAPALAVELPGDYPVTETIGGAFSRPAFPHSGTGRTANTKSLRSKASRRFDQGVERATTTLRGSDESLFRGQEPFGNAEPEMERSKRASRPFSMTRPLTSMTARSATEAMVTGGGRQRWGEESGLGRCEGFGGVIKTVEIDVSSRHAVTPPTPTAPPGI